jgi:hypothetical protein
VRLAPASTGPIIPAPDDNDDDHDDDDEDDDHGDNR